MRAFVIDRFKDPGGVRDVPDPPMGADDILVRVARAGVNPVDWKIRDGTGGKRSFPLVLGQDFAGVAEAVGANVARIKKGDRVFGCARDHGAYAERTSIAQQQHNSPISVIPDGVTDAVAAALPTPALTALAALAILGMSRRTSLVVIGAAGAVGSAAVQIARREGAHVTAVVKPGQGEAVRKLGADTVIETDGEILAAIKERRTEPFDAMLDLVNDGETLKKHAELLGGGSKLVTTIHVADEAWFRERGIEATNIVMNETPQSSAAGLDELTAMVLDGTLSVTVGAERPLADAGTVLDNMKAGKGGGKTVLRP